MTEKINSMTIQDQFNISTDEVQSDSLGAEINKCIDSINYVAKYHGLQSAKTMLDSLVSRYGRLGGSGFSVVNTPYVNSISIDDQPEYPGDWVIEQRILNVIRWNAMAMVVNANRHNDGLGGHISTYASTACLYEVGFHHFFRGNGTGRNADQIFFQGHGSPGNYSRAFFEGRLTKDQLRNFRLEMAEGGGLSSYPHPYLMPDFWQFPTVSMGLGPINAVYQARFNRYLANRGLLKDDQSTVWAFLGDGEMDEPESTAALTLAARENLNNVIYVVNCNLQRLDGPVRGNGKIIQELEGVFLGAGWNVIKLLWGADWDPLINSKYRDLLLKRMDEAVDGDFQKYVVSPGSYIREHFFGRYPELLECVSHLTDKQLTKLLRGGHDPKKIYAAYKAAKESDKPTVILAKTVKGYGLGEAGEGKNVSHNQKKMNEKELREFSARFKIPISDEDIVETPFYLPSASSEEMKYLHQKRRDLGGFLPERKIDVPALPIPNLDAFESHLKSSGDSEISTTMGFSRILTQVLRDPEIGQFVVPIIPDEARTFGMESFFRQFGIYSAKGQVYEPVDSDSLLYYREAVDGQIFEEGINEAGAMSTFTAAGTAYATHGINMIPVYIYYSMFGFQRVGDMMWLCGDMQAKGFLIGGTAGRTTLNGEGLQHQDGHSHLIAGTVPNLYAYDIAFRYETAVIFQNGLQRMYQDNEQIFYYLTVGNENYFNPEMPKGAEEGILQGMYSFSRSKKKSKQKAHVLGSGSLMRYAIKAAEILEASYQISVDVWGVTSYKRLRTDALNAQRYNMLHPTETPKTSYLQDLLASEKGSFLAVSDNMKIVSDQIGQWVPGGLFSLGTDGFGRSETREHLREFFEVDETFIVVGVLYKLHLDGQLDASIVDQAIKDQGIDPNKIYPILAS